MGEGQQQSALRAEGGNWRPLTACLGLLTVQGGSLGRGSHHLHTPPCHSPHGTESAESQPPCLEWQAHVRRLSRPSCPSVTPEPSQHGQGNGAGLVGQGLCPTSLPWFSERPLLPLLGSGVWSLLTCSSSSFKANRTFVNYDPMDEIQIAEINSQVRRYLEGTLDEIDVRSLSSGPCPPYPGHPPLVLGWPWNLILNGCSGYGVGGAGPLALGSTAYRGLSIHV